MTKPGDVPEGESSHGSLGRLARSRLLAQLCLPDEMVISLPGSGSLAVKPRFVGIESVDDWIEEAIRSCESVSLKCGASFGLLLVDRRLALATVSAVLGCPMPVVVGPLSRIERGILEGTIATVLARLALVPGVRLRAGGTTGQDFASFSIEISAQMQGITGHAHLCGTDEFFERAWAAHGHSLAPDHVLATLRVEVAHTCLPSSELDAVSEGDAIVFEDVGTALPSEPWSVQLRQGQMVFSALAYPDGTIHIENNVARESAENTKTKPEGCVASGSSGSRCEMATASLKGAAFVEITAEIGRIQVHHADLAGLLCGLSIGPRRIDQILLNIGGTPWAEGEILTIGGEFCVRITRKLAG